MLEADAFIERPLIHMAATMSDMQYPDVMPIESSLMVADQPGCGK